MPRIRTFKPESRQHRKTGRLTDFQHRLWAGMILEADDEGRLVWDAEQLRGLIWSYHPNVAASDVDAAMRVLATVGLVRVYRVRGQEYVFFPSWNDHQKIDKPRPSTLPAPPANTKNRNLGVHESSTNDRRPVGEASKSIRRGSKGSEGSTAGTTGPATTREVGTPDGAVNSGGKVEVSPLTGSEESAEIKAARRLAGNLRGTKLEKYLATLSDEHRELISASPRASPGITDGAPAP
jgi:hypothetical protein